MSAADHALNFEEQTQIAMRFSEEDSQDRDLQAALQASLYSEQFSGEDAEYYNGIALSLGINTDTLSDTEKRELYANIAESLGHALHERDVAERQDGPASQFNSHDAASINRESDEAYAESVRIDRETDAAKTIRGFMDFAKAAREVKKQKQRVADAAAAVEVRAVQEAKNQIFIAKFEAKYLGGDVVIRFEYNARTLVELRLNVNTPIHLLTEYLASKYNLSNVELSNLILGQLQKDNSVSQYCSSGARIKLNITADSAAGGYNSRKRQSSKRQTSRRQISKRQSSKRQTSRRQNSRRKF